MMRTTLGWWTGLAVLGLASGATLSCGEPETTPAPTGGAMTPGLVPRVGAAGSTATQPLSASAGAVGAAVPPRTPTTSPAISPPVTLPGSGGAGTGPVAPAMAAAGGAPGGAMTPPPAGMPPGAAGGGAPQTPPVAGDWPEADPAKPGPFATVTETEVGHGMAFTMVRPRDLMRRHPVITWGNGTGTTPPTYGALLDLYASHGFIVIASNSENVAQGDPPPMLDGVTWVLEQDMTPGTALFEHVDRENIGATGHSQGAFAASSAGLDARIKSIAPIETLGASRGLHGPVLGLCGTMDEIVPCSSNMRSFSAIADQPVMYAELKVADHTNWIFSPGGAHPFWVITNAWFRVHLMGDVALRPLFYGADCSYCNDDAWVVMRKMMD